MHPPPSNLHAVSPNRYHTTFTTSGAGGESVELRGEGQRQCQLADVSDTNNDSNTLTSNDLLHRGIGLPVVDLMASVVGISSLVVVGDLGWQTRRNISQQNGENSSCGAENKAAYDNGSVSYSYLI